MKKQIPYIAVGCLLVVGIVLTLVRCSKKDEITAVSSEEELAIKELNCPASV